MNLDNPIRMLVFDLDGTLLHPGKAAFEGSLQALDRYLCQGIHVALATARPLDAVDGLLPGTLTRRLWKVCHNGAVTVSPQGRMIQYRAIDGPLFLSIAHWIEARRPGMEMSWYADGTWYAPSTPGPASMASYGIPPDAAHRHPLPEKRHYRHFGHARIEKILLPYFPLRHELVAAYGNDITAIATHDDSLTMVMAHGVDKAGGMAAILAELALDKRDVLVFGDDNNDIELFRQHPHCVAMGNATPELKAMARHIAGRHDEPDAIANVLRLVERAGFMG